jgi:ferric-dicitrate binding protein FerR (iron transport regulator)
MVKGIVLEQQELYLLITRHFNTQATIEEETFLEEWLAASEENRQTYATLENIWQSATVAPDEENIAAALQLVKQRIDNRQHNNVFVLLKKYGIAAAIAGIVISNMLIFSKQLFQGHSTLYIEKKSLPGQILKEIMPDGTVVYLAPASSIRYREDFGKTQRTISLEGEAFFEVTKDAHQPFYVQAGTLSVHVLGTRFNVTHYKNAANTVVSLVDGKVQVHLSHTDTAYTLQPGQELYYDNQSQYAYQRMYDVAAVTGWTARLLVFRNEPLSVVAHRLEQLYDVKISFDDPAIKDYRLFARFKDQPLSYILDVIKETDNLDYTINGKEIRFFVNNTYHSH